MDEFYASLQLAKPKAAILSIIPGYSETFNTSSLLPPTIQDFAKPDYMDFEYADLLHECENIFCSFSVNAEQAAYLEQVTREQTRSRLWYSHRAGRITASKLYQAAQSPPDCPSMSVINAICYPQNVQFQSCATRWSIENEHAAREQFKVVMKAQHNNFGISLSGLVINQSTPSPPPR